MAVRALLTTGSVYTTATAIQLSGAVVVIPAVTRLLGPAQYGELALGLIVLLLLGTIAAAGLPGAITRAYFRPDEGGHHGARRLVPATLALSLVVAAVAELTGQWWAGLFGDLEYDATLRVAVWGAPAAAVMGATQGLLRAENRATAFIVVAVLSGLGGQLAGLALVAGWDVGPAGFMAGAVGATYLAAVLGTALSGGATAGFADRRGIASALVVGLPTVPHFLAGFLLATGDRIALERNLDLDAVGRYQVAYAVGSIGIIVLTALNNAWAPLIYGAKPGERWRTLADTTAGLYPLAALAGGGLALVAPLALIVAAPSGYDPADLTPVSAIVAFAVIPYLTYLSAVHIVFWRGRTGVLAWSTPLSAVVNLTLVVLLVGPLGLEGAAAATVVGYGLLALLVHRRARHMATVPWRWSSAFGAAALAAALVLAGAVGPADGAWLPVRAVAGLACAVAFLAVGRRLIKRPTAPHPTAQGGARGSGAGRRGSQQGGGSAEPYDVGIPQDHNPGGRAMAHRSVMVGRKPVGQGHPSYLIAEVGSNHDGEEATAHALIDAAADAGVDAVKFQTYTGSRLYSASTPRFEYLGELGDQPIGELLDRVALPREWQPLLAEHCRERGVDFLSTPFDREAVEELDAIDVPAFKVASFEITDLPFLRLIGSKGRPVILSTGMADLEEIAEALEALQETGTDRVILLQCASLYPAPPKTINLRAMDTMRQHFGLPVGLSDHTLGIHVAVGAVARGAVVVEKHLTLDRSRNGPDHPFAIEPPELRDLVAQVREIEAALGDGRKAGPTEEEAVEMYRNARRSVVAAVPIPKGTTITEDMLTSKRPGYGIAPKHLPDLAGRVARVDIGEDEVVTWDMV